MASQGPIACAQAFVLLQGDREGPVTERIVETAQAFQAVFAQRPQVFRRGVRDLLAPITQAPRAGDASA